MGKVGGLKCDGGKPPMGLLDRYALEQVARVLLHGAEKYSRYNWRGGLALSRLYDAALRHIFAFIDGEDLDPETKLSHIAHSICCLMFLLRTQRDRPDLDDRYKVATPDLCTCPRKPGEAIRVEDARDPKCPQCGKRFYVPWKSNDSVLGSEDERK